MDPVRIDEASAAGAKAADRLRRELIAWLTTVSPEGVPQTSPVWFWWAGGEFLVYSRRSVRVRNIAAHPEVSLHLDGDGEGGGVVVVEGRARLDEGFTSPDRHPEYLAKYRRKLDEYGWSAEYFADHYPVPVRISPTRYRYW